MRLLAWRRCPFLLLSFSWAPLGVTAAVQAVHSGTAGHQRCAARFTGCSSRPTLAAAAPQAGAVREAAAAVLRGELAAAATVCLRSAASATAVAANRPPGCDELKRHFLNVLRIGCHACLSHAQVVEQVDRLMVLRRQTGWDSAAAAAMLEVRSSNWVPCILRWRNTVPRRYGTT